MNTAIVVAAGSGNRFGGDTPKQFVDLLGKPVLAHTLARFESSDSIDSIVTVVSEEFRGFVLDLVRDEGITKVSEVISGGRTRAESVRNGLQGVTGEGIVLVHDGARPVLPQTDISAAVLAAETNGASCLVAPITETVKRVEEEFILGTVERSGLRRALTPQCFRSELILAAYSDSNFWADATDDCLLVERLGEKITAVEGSPLNIKITREEDLAHAEINLKRLLEEEERSEE